MIEEHRPNPEELLEIIKREEMQRRKGKLKIFLGMAAGVGKTYAMLEAAQKLLLDGVDLVVGVINTHGRQETASLLQGLEIIPEKTISYKESTFHELDIDAILKRNPRLVLVDELAHSNMIGSRHPKRWQDVVEILDQGIDVFTTLNVQHIESIKDVVEGITGITIRETVPDQIIDSAAFIELVDLTTDELLRRLKEGKVYLGDQSVIAARHFFQKDRLTALREIVLRYAAEKIDHDLHDMFATTEHVDAWKPRERLLVAVSHSDHSQKLIRTTRRLAFNLDAPWIALHVDEGKQLSQIEQDTLDKNLALARDLGGEVMTTSNANIGQAIHRIARQRSVTQIIIGRSPRMWWMRVFERNTLLDYLVKECSDIDLHVIRKTLYIRSPEKKLRLPQIPENLSKYLSITLIVLAMTLFNWLFLPSETVLLGGFIFLLWVQIYRLMSKTNSFFKTGPFFFSAILYGALWIGLFVVPASKSPSPPSSLMNAVTLAISALTVTFTGILGNRARKNNEMLLKREKSIEALYDIVKEIASSLTLKKALSSVTDKLSSVLDGKCQLILKQPDNGLVFDSALSFANDEKEKIAAEWVYLNGKEAGWSTSTLPKAHNYFIPLHSNQQVIGVLAFCPHNERKLSSEEKNFLYTVGHQIASFLERSTNEEKARKLEQHQQVEKIYQAIMNLLSNLFEGPLLSIQDAAKELKKVDLKQLTPEIGHSIESLTNSSESLTRILENISAMLNLSAGLVPIKRQKNDIKELTLTTFEKIKKTEISYQWNINVEDDLPMIYFDCDLIELLFYNMAFHVMEFSFPESKIDVEAKRSGDDILVKVFGQGQSIPPELIEVTFEKFYRMPSKKTSGLGSELGLGIAIARTIAEIHSGQLLVESLPQGGMSFTLILPIT